MNEIENWKRFSRAMAHRRPSVLEETVTVRAVLLNAAFLIGCILIPVVLALAFLR